MRANISADNGSLIRHLADVSGLSVNEVVNNIIVYYRAHNVHLKEDMLQKPAFVELAKPKGELLSGEDLHNVLIAYFQDVDDRIHEELANTQDELDKKQKALEAEHERLRAHILALANFMVKKERENKAPKGSYIRELVKDHPKIVEYEAVMQNMN